MELTTTIIMMMTMMIQQLQLCNNFSKAFIDHDYITGNIE